jgi:hypothetical protein
LKAVSWVAYIFAAFIALTNLIALSKDADVQKSMRMQGLIIASACGAVWLFHWDKLLTPVAIPVSMVMASIIIGGYVPKSWGWLVNITKKAFRD